MSGTWWQYVPFILASVLILLLATIGVFDAWVILYPNGACTVSDVVKSLSSRYPIVPFFAGFLAGHLWF